MNYRDALQSWHDFYVTSGAASATLAGLLFVGLSLHLRVVVSHPEVRGLARITLSNFFVVLVVSLFALIPTGQAQSTAVELLGVAVVALILGAPVSVEAIRSRRAQIMTLRTLISRFGLSVLAYLTIGVMAIVFYEGDFAVALGWLVAAVVVLLLTSVRNTWDLLVTVASKS
jgi:hypothetical protein